MPATHLSSADFEEKTKSGAVLLDFWASWCGPCRSIGPIIDQLADEFADQALIAKVNVEDEGDLAAKFGIRSIPALIIMKDGEVVEQLIGAKPKDVIKGAIEKAIG